jgi:hypothetical protein
MSGNDILHASSISPQVLVSQQLGATEAAIYTAAAGQSVKVAHGALCNTTATAVIVYLSVIKAGGTLGDGTHRVISGYSLAANDTLSLKDYLAGAMLGPGDAIAAYASATAAVDLVVTGTVHA